MAGASAGEGSRRTPSSAGVLGASVISGVSGYAVLVLIARHLTLAENSRFLVFWGLLFGLFGCLGGVQAEAARTVRAAQVTPGPPAPPGRRTGPTVGTVSVVVGLTGGVLVLASASLWGEEVFGSPWWAEATATAIGVAGFAGYSGLSGCEIGSGAYRRYAGLLTTDGVGRLVLVALAIVGSGSVLALTWATALASCGWLCWVASCPQTRRAWSAPADVSAAHLVGRMAVACSATAASAALVVGFPVLVRVTTSDEVYAGAAPVLLALSLTRAPLLVPLTAYQGVLVARVVSDGIRPLGRLLGLLTAVTVGGVPVAWAAGPWLLRVVNPEYLVAGQVFAGLTLGAGLIAALTMTGAACLGLSGHGAYAAGWLAATAASLALLALALPLPTRVVVALVGGPVLGIGVHLAWLVAHRRGRGAQGDTA